jgi:hypothetical protein
MLRMQLAEQLRPLTPVEIHQASRSMAPIQRCSMLQQQVCTCWLLNSLLWSHPLIPARCAGTCLLQLLRIDHYISDTQQAARAHVASIHTCLTNCRERVRSDVVVLCLAMLH